MLEALRKDLNLKQSEVLLKNIVECMNHLQYMKDIVMVEREEAKLKG